MKQSVREVYNELYRYFGLRSNDRYTSAATGNKGAATSEKPATPAPLGEVYHTIYGDEDYNPDIREICEKIASLQGGLNVSKKMFCITPYKDPGTNDLGDTTNLPLNDPEKTRYNDQGVVPSGGQFKGTYTIQRMGGNDKFGDSENRIDVIQIFPVKGVPELADTDVITLYLSTINSVNMSLAVPYVNVLVSTPGDGPISSEPFSFGKFLGATGDVSSNARFIDQSIGSQNARPVASMEIFTSPQTLVNATPENVRYNENEGVRRHIDVFRPFLSLENLSLSVVPANAGLIAFKTAQMRLKLLDRGRLADIAPIVAPSRFTLVKFDIEYGWSHPAGTMTAGRQADANDDRIGQLIDSMRVTESYQVVNSNFTFEQDGSVSIELKLSMLGRKNLANNSVKFSAEDGDLVELQHLMKEIQDQLATNAPKTLNKVSFLKGGVDTYLSVKPEDIRKLKDALKSKTFNDYKGLKDNLSKLLDPQSGITKFQKTRQTRVSEFITRLGKENDPFLRIAGLSSGGNRGVTRKEIEGGNYASLGRVMTMLIGDVFQPDSEVIFIFGCFNKNAGAMYDHNISQFPIKLRSTGKKRTVSLQNVLNDTFTRQGDISPEALIGILNKFFLSRDDAEAYGLSDIYAGDAILEPDDQVKEQTKVKIDTDVPKTQLDFEKKKIENLKSIYGENRTNPNFTIPRINVKIDTKPGVGGKLVTRIVVTDQAASNVGDIQEIFDDATRTGYFIKESIPSPNDENSFRSAGHGDVANEVFEEMSKNELFEFAKPEGDVVSPGPPVQAGPSGQTPKDPKKEVKQDAEKILKIKDFSAIDSKLRNVLYKYFPTLIYGSMGSGIISAQLSSNQNDALTTIMLQRRSEDEPLKPGLPVMIHPTQLSMEVFGTPMFKYSQKFFVDFGTGTSADNFYVVTGVDMNFSPGEFKTNLKMTLLDVYGRFMNTGKEIAKNLVATEAKSQQVKKEKS